MVLAMTALLTHLVPAICLKARNQLLNFRWHRPLIVLRTPGSGFVRGMLSVGPTFGLPKGALAIRSEMRGPLAGDGDLIGALVGHVDLRPNVELTGRRRQDARPWLAKMYRVPPDRAWWPAVGAPVERHVRPRLPVDNRAE